MIQAWTTAKPTHRAGHEESTRTVDRRTSLRPVRGVVDMSDGLGTGHILALIDGGVGGRPRGLQVRLFAL
nr:hypothetical protein GCM10025730_35290 [Promicromonospora thailandica]